MPLAALAAAATAFADRREIPEIPSAENPYWGGGSMKLLISDWYRFDSDLRHAMEGMRRYYVYKEESCLRGLAE